jgi:hypothetical protein
MSSGSPSIERSRVGRDRAFRLDPAWPPGFVACAVALAFYSATLLPGVAFWDTGEMQTVPYVLGIAHPTGFPLFVLGGWLFSHALPFGEPAWRLSLFSACASAAATGVLAAFVFDLAGSAFVAVAAGLAFALGDVAWTRGVRAEVHDLALLAFAVAVFAAARAARDRSSRALAVAALAVGLGTATHPIVALAIPGIFAIAWPAIAVVPARALVAAAALAVLPLALYAYVPLRSGYVESHALDPERRLGVVGGAIWDSDAPASPAAFARYVSGAAFHPAGDAERALAPSGVAQAVTLAASTAYREYSALALALALCGLTFLGLRQPFLAGGLVAVGVADIAFASNFGAESDVARYALEGLWGIAGCAGVGAFWIASAIVGERPRAIVAVACALSLGGLWPNAPLAYRDLGRERRFADARALAGDVTRRTAPGSLVIASWSFATPLAYDAYVTRAFDRSLLCGWPRDYAGRFGAWRARFGHVYFVLSSHDDASSFATRLYANDRYQIAELRT